MATEENLAQQRQLYGEPLADITGRVRNSLNLTQAGLAQILGLSAPMMSQLQAATLTATQRTERLKEIQEATPTISTSLNPAVRELHNAAPPEELLRLAELTTSPELTRLLRIAARHG